jgi:hypothetical protein
MAFQIESEFGLKEGDLDLWTSQRFISVEEGLILLFGGNPQRVSLSLIERSRICLQYRFYLGLLEREFTGGEAYNRQISPVRFLEMAEACKVVVPETVKEAILRNRRQLPKQSGELTVATELPTKPKDDVPDPRVLDTLYTIIYALAVEKYRFDPESARSEVPTKIEDAVNRQGFTISAKTIRTHLQAASNVALKRK